MTPVEVWSHLRGAIIDARATVDFRPLTDWLRVEITKKISIYQPSPLTMLRPTDPLAYGDLILYRHQVLTCHIPGLDPTLQRVQGFLIATHIG